MSDILPESWKSSLTACRVTKPWSRIYIVFTDLKKKSWLLLKFYFKDLKHLCLAHTICHIQLFPQWPDIFYSSGLKIWRKKSHPRSSIHLFSQSLIHSLMQRVSMFLKGRKQLCGKRRRVAGTWRPSLPKFIPVLSVGSDCLVCIPYPLFCCPLLEFLSW